MTPPVYLMNFSSCILTYTHNYLKWYTNLCTIFINKIAAKYEIKKFNENNFSLWKMKMRAILRKNNCLTAIKEMSMEITDDDMWNEMDSNAIADLHLTLADGVLSSVEEKKQRRKYKILLQNCTRLSHNTTKSS